MGNASHRHGLTVADAPAGFRGGWRTDEEARAAYSEAAGIGRVMPRAVALPADADDVVTLVRWAAATGMPLTPRGSGSSMAGGALGDGVIVDLGRLREPGTVDVAGRGAHVQPAVLRGTVARAAEVQGLRFPVDPSSGAFCTIGGMVATNAAGAHSLRYGSTRAWVRALDCVFADGTRALVRRGETPPGDIPALARFAAAARRAGATRMSGVRAVRKNSSGYAVEGDLVDLLVGSEGTLAIFVGIELALTPLPGGTASLLGAFPGLDEAAAAAARARELGAAACELLDRTFVDLVRDGGGTAAAAIPGGTEAVLLIEVEASNVAEASREATDMARRIERAGASVTRVAGSPAEAEALWSLRHAASPILGKLDPALKSMQFIEDGVVPPDRLPEYIRGVRAALDAVGVRGVIFGHAGDAHIHVNPLVDVRDADWRARVETLFDEVCALTVRLGGTMSGEHGDGRLRAPVLATILGADAASWATAVKDAFDPSRILNPGVKEPLVGQRPIEDVKYDPQLPPLPRRARGALDIVAGHRAYARNRLDLLEEGTTDSVAALPTPDPAD